MELTLIQMHSRIHDNYNTQRYRNISKASSGTYLRNNGSSTNKVQAFHEPSSLIPHYLSAQQWVTPELRLSSTLKAGNPRLG
jgi:hypothetical protein